MQRSIAAFAIWTLCGSLCLGSTRQIPLSAIRDLTYTPCTSADWNVLSSPEVISLVSAERLDEPDSGWVCQSISTNWILPGSLLTLSGELAIDHTQSFSLLRANGHYWLIPALNGMLPSDDVLVSAGNRAKFNQFLGVLHYVPSSQQDWIQLALLYLAIVDKSLRIQDYEQSLFRGGSERREGLIHMEPTLRNFGMLPSVICRKGTCVVTLSMAFELAQKKLDYSTYILEFKTYRNLVSFVKADEKSGIRDL